MLVPTGTNIFCFLPRRYKDAPTRFIASQIHLNQQWWMPLLVITKVENCVSFSITVLLPVIRSHPGQLTNEFHLFMTPRSKHGSGIGQKVTHQRNLLQWSWRCIVWPAFSLLTSLTISDMISLTFYQSFNLPINRSHILVTYRHYIQCQTFRGEAGRLGWYKMPTRRFKTMNNPSKRSTNWHQYINREPQGN
jgi:hypothetical protein